MDNVWWTVGGGGGGSVVLGMGRVFCREDSLVGEQSVPHTRS